MFLPEHKDVFISYGNLLSVAGLTAITYFLTRINRFAKYFRTGSSYSFKHR